VDAAFLHAIGANPDDNTNRLVYADWLDEHDDPRGTFLRVECELAAIPPEARSRRLLVLAELLRLGRECARGWAQLVSRVPIPPVSCELLLKPNPQWTVPQADVELVNETDEPIVIALAGHGQSLFRFLDLLYRDPDGELVPSRWYGNALTNSFRHTEYPFAPGERFRGSAALMANIVRPPECPFPEDWGSRTGRTRRKRCSSTTTGQPCLLLCRSSSTHRRKRSPASRHCVGTIVDPSSDSRTCPRQPASGLDRYLPLSRAWGTMSTSQLQTRTPAPPGAAFLQDLFSGVSPRDFAVRFSDGTTWEADPGQPTRFTLVLKHPGAVRNMFWPPNIISVAEAYLFDDFDVEGDVLAYGQFCDRLDDYGATLSILTKLKYAWRLWRMPRVERARAGRQAVQLSGEVHSRERDQQAISFHYDVSNEFFAQILDSRMVYTCGIFAHPDEDLDTAQERKVDLVCRKLRLKPGERFLDIGCGWGEQVIHAAKNYGAHAVGVTISRPQAEWAQRKVREAGLENRVRIDLLDYRDVDEREPFDKISILEVGEHFGRAQFPTFFQKCWRLLRPQGSLLQQQITMSAPEAMRKAARAFIRAYLFPDGELVPASFLQSEAEKVGFEVRDVESFREHYQLTLRHWLNNLENHHDEIVRLTDEATYRTFRLYLAGSRRLFTSDSRYNVHQMLFVKAQPASGYPLSCEDWYAKNGT
jgi:cyclopropane-fatty-acyl-phospholipid synthase